MDSKKFSLFVVIYFASIDILISQTLNGKCGYPGKPYQAKLEPDNKLQYEEGEEVSYQCTHFWAPTKNRKCEKGKWTGEQPRCGRFLSIQSLIRLYCSNKFD